MNNHACVSTFVAVTAFLCAPTSGQVGEMDPCIRRELERGRTVAAQMLAPIVGHVGDLDGDGFADIGAIDSNFVNTPLSIRSGANGSLLLVVVPDKQDRAFLTFFDAGDVDMDGTLDISLGTLPSVYSVTGLSLLAIHSGTTGKLICSLIPGTSTMPLRVIVPADVDASGEVTIHDAGAVVEALGDTSLFEIARFDVDKDNSVTLSDVLDVALAAGMEPASQLDLSRVWSTLADSAAVTAGGDWVEYRDAQGTLVVAGIVRIIRCFLCGLSCGDALDTAWACREWFWDRYCACYAIPDQLDQTECLERTRREGLTACLVPIIDAAGECADCIRKCSPTTVQ